LGGDDLKVVVDAADVAVVVDALGLFGGGGGLALLVGFGGEDAEGDEVVFDLLVGGEDGLAVGGGGAVEAGEGLLGDAAAAAGVEEGLAECRAEGVDEAGFVEERGDGGGLEADGGGEVRWLFWQNQSCHFSVLAFTAQRAERGMAIPFGDADSPLSS